MKPALRRLMVWFARACFLNILDLVDCITSGASKARFLAGFYGADESVP